MDYDLIRYLLLQLESTDEFPVSSEIFANEKYSYKEINFHTNILLDYKYIEAKKLSTEIGNVFAILRMTGQGHEYLNAVRDDVVWKKILQKIAGQAGILTLDMVKEVAVKTIRDNIGI